MCTLFNFERNFKYGRHNMHIFQDFKGRDETSYLRDETEKLKNRSVSRNDTSVILIAVGDQMFLGMQDFDFCPNLIEFYLNFTKFYPIYPFILYPKFAQILPKLA